MHAVPATPAGVYIRGRAARESYPLNCSEATSASAADNARLATVPQRRSQRPLRRVVGCRPRRALGGCERMATSPVASWFVIAGKNLTDQIPHKQNVQGLEDPAEMREGLPELGRVPVVLQHPHRVTC